MGVKIREWKKGQWWILIDHKGKRKSVKVGSKEAAKAAARKIEEALTTGKLNLDPPKPPKSLLFTEYAEKWFAGHVSVNLKPSTQHWARLILDKVLLPAFGDKPLDKITRDDVKTFAYRMLEAGRAKEIKLADGGKTKTLSRSSVMGMGRTLSAISITPSRTASSHPTRHKGQADISEQATDGKRSTFWRRRKGASFSKRQRHTVQGITLYSRRRFTRELVRGNS